MNAADLGWIVAGVALGAYDIWLGKTKRPMLTDSARKHVRITAAVFIVLGLHFLDVLGPLDPFKDVARLFGVVIR